MSLDEFFDSSSESKVEKKIVPQNDPLPETSEHTEGTQKKIVVKDDEYINTEFDVGQDLDDLLLLDVQYNNQINGAQCVFYHQESKSLYRWNDTTGHKPYLLTTLTPESIETISQIKNSHEYQGTQTVTRYHPIEDGELHLTKVYSTTPLGIGGDGRSFRNYIEPAFEANIRYHLNYIADEALTPGTYYKVENGELLPSSSPIDPEVRGELLSAFQGESKEQLDMLNEYMPLLFQKIPEILRCAFDIEVDSEKGRLPSTTEARDRIISIALQDSEGRKYCWVLDRDEKDSEIDIDGIQVILCANERSLLEQFFEVVDRYPIALSFNGDNFDAPYLINRAKRIGFADEDIPLSKRGRSDTYFNNAIHIDLYLFFRQASIRIYAFSAKYEQASLDELATTLLGEGKLEHPDLWINELDLETLVKYNIKDAELTLRLTQFDNNVVLRLVFILMRICKMPIYDFTRTAVSGWLQMWLIYEHRKRKYLIPRKSDILAAKGATAISSAIIDGKNFQGAIVLEPQPGIWWDVHVLDFASLYPSIIKTRNLSYETILCGHEECKSNVVPEVGHYACTKRVGLFAIILGFVRDTRVKWFKPRSSDEELSELERTTSRVIQSSLKVLINAGYGVFGSENFDFYCPPVAESTTAYARNAITSTKNFVEQDLGIKVLYGDTDSVFIYQPTPEKVNRLLTWALDNVGIELGTDYIFRYVIFSDRKKNYLGITTRGNIVVKGLSGKKSNTPKIVRVHFSKMLEILKNIQSPDEFETAKEKILVMLQRMIGKLENLEFSPEDISVRVSLSKRLKEYSTWTQGMQVAAQLLAHEEYKDTITEGSSIEFVKLRRPFKIVVPPDTELSFPVGSIQEVSVKPLQLVTEEDLDGKPVIKDAKSTFEQILEPLGITWDDVLGVKSLDNFF